MSECYRGLHANGPYCAVLLGRTNVYNKCTALCDVPLRVDRPYI
jgi:hypothetical protein